MMDAIWNSPSLRGFVAAVTTLATWMPALSASATEPSAIDYLTPQSVAAVTVRLADVAQTPLVQAYPVEVVAAATDDFLGVRLESVQRVTAIVEPPMGMTPQYAVVLNSTESISFDRFRAEALEHTTPGEVLDRPARISQKDGLPSLCLLDKHTLAVGPKLFLKRLVRGVDGSGGELAAAMRSGGGDRDQLRGAVLLQPLMPLIQMGMMAAKQEAPPETHKYLDGVELLDRVVLSADLSGERESSLVVHANDAAAADRVETLLEEGLSLWRERTLSSEQMQQIRGHEEAVVRAWGIYLDRIYTEKTDQIDALREGDDAFVLGRIKADEPMTAMTTLAVTGILVALILPAVQAAREAARRNVSLNNAKQLMLAMHNYHDKNGSFPAHAIYSDAGEPLLSWRVAVLPFLGEPDLYERFKKDEPWNSEHNLPLLSEMPELFLDPSSPRLGAADGKTHYLGVVRADAAFTGDATGRHFRHFTDGTSMTMMLVQVDDQHAVEWTKPIDFDFAKHRENPFEGIGSIHPGVFLASFADGHVRSIQIDTDPELLRKTMTANGGEVIDDLP